MSIIPTLWLYLQTTEVQFQFVAYRSGRRTCRYCFKIAKQTAQVFSIKSCVTIYIGIVTATYHFVVDNYLVVEIDSNLSRYNDTSHITAAIEGTKLGGVWNIVGTVAICCALKHNCRLYLHGTTFHVFGKDTSIGQSHLTEFCIIVIRILKRSGKGAQHTFTSDKVIVSIVFNHVLSVIAEEHVVDGHIRANLDVRLVTCT